MASGLSLLGGAPRRLAFRPPGDWIGDADAAHEMLSGRFRLGGGVAEASPEAGPWRLTPPGPGFARALHRFDWLADLAAADTEGARDAARRWTFGWIAQAEGQAARMPALAWEAETTAVRLLAWLERADLLIAADPALERQLAGAADAHLRRLKRAQAAPGLPTLAVACAVFAGTLALESSTRRREQALSQLEAAADEAVGADGGLASRNPEALCESLIRLETAAAQAEAAGLAPGRAFSAALARAGAALRVLRLRDGGLGRFHGGGPGRSGRLDHALNRARPAQGQGPGETAMGFVRLAAGRTAILIDAAPPPDGPLAHASTLAFEFTVGRRRLVANCGPGDGFGGDWAAACRATAAQSTLSLAGVSSSRVAEGGDGGFSSRPAQVQAETAKDLDGAWFLGGHDGYLAQHGLLHSRRLFLSPDGRDFRGEDALEAPGGAAPTRASDFALRFHLPPDVADLAEELPDGGVRLDLPEGAWEFAARGGEVRLDESVHLDAERRAPAAARQIVVAARLASDGARVVWAFTRAA
ncbi:MAG: heparinase II/III family protein [Pseudomonadota bacterium]